MVSISMSSCRLAMARAVPAASQAPLAGRAGSMSPTWSATTSICARSPRPQYQVDILVCRNCPEANESPLIVTQPLDSPESPPKETDTDEPQQTTKEPPKWDPPVSPGWQKDCRRNGAAIVSLFLVALLAWITASQTFIVLNGNKLVHPSSLSWPLYLCIAGVLLGGYVFAASGQSWLPIPGREYEKPDHRMKYSLWFQEVVVEWNTSSREPYKINALAGIGISNGGNDTPIIVEVERLDVQLNGVTPTTSKYFFQLRLLPNQRKDLLSDLIDDIPRGNASGEIAYSLRYGPVSGFPVYRRTHKVRFQIRAPITSAMIRGGQVPGLTWTELEPEQDTDIYPPAPAS